MYATALPISSPLKFPQKLWKIANECQTDAICWSADGKSILVRYSLFRKEFMSSQSDFFKTDNIASFVRQLNLYGFRKVTTHKQTYKSHSDVHEFSNKFFQRRRPDLLERIARKSVLLKDKSELVPITNKSMECADENFVEKNEITDIKTITDEFSHLCVKKEETHEMKTHVDHSYLCAKKDENSSGSCEIHDVEMKDSSHLCAKNSSHLCAKNEGNVSDMDESCDIEMEKNSFVCAESTVNSTGNFRIPACQTIVGDHSYLREDSTQTMLPTQRVPLVEDTLISVYRAEYNMPEIHSAIFTENIQEMFSSDQTQQAVEMPVKKRRGRKPKRIQISDLTVDYKIDYSPTLKNPGKYAKFIMNYEDGDDDPVFLRKTSKDVMWSSTMPFGESIEYHELKEVYVRQERRMKVDKS